MAGVSFAAPDCGRSGTFRHQSRMDDGTPLPFDGCCFCCYAAGGGTAGFPAESYQQQYPQHPHQHHYQQRGNPRHRGPGPYAARFQTRQQWPNVGPWSKQDDFDAAQQLDQTHPQQGRPFRFQNAPTGAGRGSGSPRPVLELRSDTYVPPDLVSPRSDSFFYSSRATRPCPSPSPSVPDFQPAYRTTAESASTARQPRSAFPGLSSNPYIPEDTELEASRSATRQFPLLARQHDQLNRWSPASNLESPVASRPATPIESNVVVENFSRPRKPSMRSQQSDSALSRPLAAQRLQAYAADQRATNPQIQIPPHADPAPNPWPIVRRLSASSSQSSSTFSSIPPRPSHDHLNPASRNNSSRHPNFGVSGAPGPYARPSPAFYTNHGQQPYPREVPPWLAGGEESRSSYRSQLTTSTAQGTVFTAVGTERNSVVTKASSITEQSIINGYMRGSWRPNSVDDGPSLEDVMGMYERGFRDSDIDSFRRSMRFPVEEISKTDFDIEVPEVRCRSMAFLEEDDSPETDYDTGAPDDDRGMAFSHEDNLPETDSETRMPDLDTSRPASCRSNASGLREKMLEAMDDSLPMSAAMPIPESNRTSRQSLNRTRRSLLPSSLPDDLGMRLATESMGKRDRAESDGMEKHDSAKVLDGDDETIMLRDGGIRSPSPTSPVEAQPPTADSPSPCTVIPSMRGPCYPQEPPEEPGSRDRYGFRKASANVTRQEYDAWDAGYSEYLARRRRKWVAYLKDNSLMTDRPNRFPPRNAKTKRFIRKGIPPDWRGAAWFYYAGGPAILSKHRGVYEQLVRRAGLDPESPERMPNAASEVKPLVVEDIEKDLYRTFPDNVQFKPPPPPPGTAPAEPAASETPPEPKIIASLRRVLHAFALYNPRTGYCQSLNFLAGLLLLFLETEEQAFWLLNVITRVYLPGTHEMSLEGSKVDLGVLMIALKDSMPAVWKQIGGDELEMTPAKKSKGRRVRDGHKRFIGGGSINDPNRLPAITLCMTAWFMSCFIGTLPMEAVLRVWDVFFYEGSRTLFRIALTLFKLGEREIKAVQDPMEMFGVVQTFPRRMLDCNMLLETCYKRRNGIGHLSQETVEERRQERRDGIRKWKADQEAAAAAAAAAASETSSTRPSTRHKLGAAFGLDLATDPDDMRRKANLFGRRKDHEQARAAEVM
ncbi:hypothetical protein BT67DRAFT_462122 [Trichocladium antarcticum]|uniref:Rab-GAP TBC domain-containing protein n=1 Tax=Trichocladium antarcticum TaxID=1450529 RepID=A0AAN6ZDL7_9PEZI|nr:hypothetical protein BT67DRAFT_462122 [Trichocladium antarcticum]